MWIELCIGKNGALERPSEEQHLTWIEDSYAFKEGDRLVLDVEGKRRNFLVLSVKLTVNAESAAMATIRAHLSAKVCLREEES